MTTPMKSDTSRTRPAGTARLTMDIPHTLHRWLRVRAAYEDTTMTEIVVRMLQSEFENGACQHEVTTHR